jgi:acetyl esterase/lipase
MLTRPELDTMASHASGQSCVPRVFDVEYRRAGAEALLARIYQPSGAGPFPALLDVHGGVWTWKDRTRNAVVDHALAARGVLVAAIDFRLAPSAPYPASIADVNYATRWLKAHAADFGADPARVGGLGASSGGHMVTLSAMRPRDPRYAALPLEEAPELDATLAYVVALWPVLDPYGRYAYAQRTGRSNLVHGQDSYFGTLATMSEASPLRILERGEPVELPPMLLVHGAVDQNVPLAMTEAFAAAYRKRGGSVDLEVVPGAPHDFGLEEGPDTTRALQLIHAFVAHQSGQRACDPAC